MIGWQTTKCRAWLVLLAPLAVASCLLFDDFAPLAYEPSPVAPDGQTPDALDGGRDGTSDTGPTVPTGAPRFVKTWLCVYGPMATDEDDTFVAGKCTGPVLLDDAGVDSGSEDIGVVKLDTVGTARWMVSFGGPGTEAPGGIAAKGPNVYVTGLQYSPSLVVGGDTLTVDLMTSRASLVAKLDRDTGAAVWGRSVLSRQLNALTCGAAATSTGVVVGCTVQGSEFSVSGTTIPVVSPGGGDEALVAALDASGALLWSNVLAGTANDKIAQVRAYSNGDLLVAMNIASSRVKDTRTSLDIGKPGDAGTSVPYLARLSGNDGRVIWSKFLGSTHANVSSIAVAHDGLSIAVGMTIYEPTDFGLGTLTPRGAGDGVVLVVDEATRGPRWQIAIGGTNPNEVDDVDGVAFDSQGNVAVVGRNRSIDTKVGKSLVPNPPQQVSLGGWAAFAAKLSPSGDVWWTKGLATQNVDDAIGMHQVSFTRNGEVRVSGGLQGTAPLDGLVNVTAPYSLYQQIVWGWGP